MRAPAVTKGLLFCLAMLVIACGRTVRPELPTAPASAMQARGESRGLRVAAEPYAEPERQEVVFGRDLQSWRLLPVLVVAQNVSDRPLLLRKRWMQLHVDDEVQLNAAASGDTVAYALGGDGVQWNRAIGGSGGLGYGTLEMGLGYLLGEAWSGQAEAAHYRDWELPESIKLRPGERLRGFIYFEIQPTTPSFEAASLEISFREREGARGALPDAEVRLPLQGLGFRREE